jgi:hypothetical protein
MPPETGPREIKPMDLDAMSNRRSGMLDFRPTVTRLDIAQDVTLAPPAEVEAEIERELDVEHPPVAPTGPKVSLVRRKTPRPSVRSESPSEVSSPKTSPGKTVQPAAARPPVPQTTTTPGFPSGANRPSSAEKSA